MLEDKTLENKYIELKKTRNLRKIILEKLDKGLVPGGFVRDAHRKVERYIEDSGEEPPLGCVMEAYSEARKKEYIKMFTILGLCAAESFHLGMKYSDETFRVIDAIRGLF